MCNPIAIYIVGTMLKARANQKARKATQNEINKTQARNDTYTNDLSQQVAKNSEQYAPVSRLDAQNQAEQQALGGMEQNLTRVREEGRGDYIPTSSGDVGRTYSVETAKRTLDTASRASKVAAMLAKMRAPTDLRTNEGLANSDIASRMSRTAREQQAMARAGEMDIRSASVPNPMMTMIGSGMQAYGSYGMAGGGGTEQPVAQSESGPIYRGNYGPYIPRRQYRG